MYSEEKLTLQAYENVLLSMNCDPEINSHYMKTVRTRSYAGPHFPAFGLNTERYRVFSPNTGKYGPD